LLRVRGQAAVAPAPDAYAVVPDGAALPVVFQTLQVLRGAGVRVQMHAAAQAGVSSMKSQFKRADGSGARFALVFGDSELAQGQVTVKALRDGAGAQQLRALADVRSWASTLQWPTP
jgi:histidyl-tRNA synthetase